MIEIYTKRWRCTECGLDARDRDPSDPENLKKYMSEYPQLKPNQCVNCGTLTMAKVTDIAKKGTMRITENQEDIDTRIAELNAEPIHKIKYGVELRPETDEEKNHRIEVDVRSRKNLKASEKTTLKNELLALPNMSGLHLMFRDETTLERSKRIDDEIKRMRIATPEEIQYLRDTFEDK